MQVIDYQDPILGNFKLHGLVQHPAKHAIFAKPPVDIKFSALKTRQF